MVLIEFRSVYLQRKNDRADDSGLPIRSANERARFRRHFPPFFAAKPRLKRRLKRGTFVPFTDVADFTYAKMGIILKYKIDSCITIILICYETGEKIFKLVLESRLFVFFEFTFEFNARTLSTILPKGTKPSEEFISRVSFLYFRCS